MHELEEAYGQSGPLEELFRARLVACGSQEVKGTELKETFSPAISFPTLKLFLFLVTEGDPELHQMDVKTVLSVGRSGTGYYH